MPYELRHFVPTVELRERIKSKQEAKFEDFTIIAYSLTGSDKASFALLEQTTAAFPKETVRNLVCLQPARLVEHEILAQLQATIKLDKNVDDELDTFGYSFTLVQKKVQGALFSGLISEISSMHDKTQIDITQFFNDLTDGKLKDTYPFSAQELESLRTIHAAISGKEPWSTDKELLKAVCVHRAIALIYTQRARAIIEPFVAASIHELCEQGVLERLEYVKKEKSIAIFTTGGVASGKGGCLKLVARALAHDPHFVPWNQLVHHNADRLKPFLQKPELNPLKYSQYTYEEALLVKEREMQLIAQKSHDLGGGKYPNFLHDQTKLKPNEILEASRRHGEIAIVAISTDVSAAVERAHGRGQTTNRYEHTKGILESHQSVPKEMINALNQEELIGSNVSMAMFDNNSPTRELSLFATIDMFTKEIIIYNKEMMQNWINKENINPKAQPGGNLYLDMETRSFEDYFTPLIEKGCTLDVQEPNASLRFKV